MFVLRRILGMPPWKSQATHEVLRFCSSEAQEFMKVLCSNVLKLMSKRNSCLSDLSRGTAFAQEASKAPCLCCRLKA